MLMLQVIIIIKKSILNHSVKEKQYFLSFLSIKIGFIAKKYNP